MKDKSITSSSLTDVLKDMCLNDELSDVTFIINDTEIPAHRVILASRSTVFKKMLFSSESRSMSFQKIKILEPAASTIEFTDFFRMLYDQEVEFNVSTALGIYHLAHYYDVPVIRQKCIDYLKHCICSENALTIGEAVYHYKDELWGHINWFIGKNCYETLKTPVFSLLSTKFIVQLLYCPLPISEVDVFHLFLPWFEAHPDQVERLSVLKHLSFPFMNPHELASIVYPKKILTEEQYHVALHASASYHWDDQTMFRVSTRCEGIWWRKYEGIDVIIDGDYRLCFAFKKQPNITKGHWKVKIPFPNREVMTGKFADTDWMNRYVYASPCSEGILFKVHCCPFEDGVLVAKFKA